MKFKRAISFISAAVMLFTTNAFALYSSENNIVAKKTVHTISPGLEYTSSVEISDGVRQEIYSFKYLPDNGTEIVPVYGEYIYGFNSVGQLISSYEGEGRVVGGINTDFFITNTGIPLSCLISDGEIISSCDNRPALGFDAVGNAIIGYPKISASFVSDDRELVVAHINKTPAVWGMYLVTDEFSSTTRTSLDSVEIVFRPFIKNIAEENDTTAETGDVTENIIETVVDAKAVISNVQEKNDTSDDTANHAESTNFQENITEDTLPAEEIFSFENYIFTEENIEAGKDIDVIVTEIRDGVKNGEIPEHSFVLCIPKEQFGYLTDGIKVGDEFVLSTDIDKAFSECANVFGAGSIILEKGEFVEQTSDSIYKYRNPRTAAGVLADGSVVFVAVDGRRSGKSEGFTIKELADYLKDIGCISAVNFDGGGSTTFYAADIGEVYSELKNTPSEDSERRVADGLIFVNTTEPTGNIEHGAIYPGEYFVYSGGASVDFSQDILFADNNLHPAIVNEAEIELKVDERYGDTYDSTFIPNGNTGRAAITATVTTSDETKLIDVGHINITDTVNRIDISSSQTFMTPFDTSVKLDVKAYLNTIPVEISPKSVEWDIYIEKEFDDGTTGIVDVNSDYADVYYDTMEFVPFIKGEKYLINVSIGGFSQQIKIFADEMPYSDIDGHWAARTAYDMNRLRFITGEISADGTHIFAPDRNMTRAEFCVILARILGLEPYVWQEAELQNADMIQYEAHDAGSGERTEEVSENITKEQSSSEDGKGDEDIPEDTQEYNFDDVPEWAKGYVKVLYDNGYIAELLSEDEEGNLTIKAEEYITRKDVIRVLGSLLDSAEITEADIEEISGIYPDFASENENDFKYFAAIIKHGIITGYEDGTVRQDLNLTRAEAATVFSRFYSTFKE